ncbi:acyl-CoA-binding domain-containing protein 6 isoform X2 [Magnolia sinica]|uniref:acyl-CoA-binding domain-containing protein 6 isoform X2 n=1 Tax=Magnolia sinica TaxID=86752 RepID=UPI00265A5BF8|nr:acyl-CoA-binding domain-containing protein 6 isoform X2 [Magnolia sinica]
MFGFSRRRMKLGRLKVQLADSTQGTKSPIRHTKRLSHSNIENVVSASSYSDDLNCQCSSTGFDLNNCTSGNSQNWMPLSTAGDKPTPRFNHAATVVGSKMVVVGGESGRELLEDVQVLNFDKLTWTATAPKLYLSPTSLPLKIPACKGHSLVSWGKKVLLIGGKTDPVSERVSVWAFDIETECWSHVEAKGDIPVARSGHTVTRAGFVLILFGGEDSKGRKLNDLHMFDLKSLTWLPLHCTGTGPSPRSNHVAALYDDRILLIFGGASKSRTLNDLYSLDFETMVWSRTKIRGFHPTPRAGCCGVLCGSKWYIAGGGSRKKRPADTVVFDVLKVEWTVAVTSSPSSVTTNKGFSLVLMQHKDRAFLVAFGGSKKEPSNQVEILIMVKNEHSMGRQSAPDKDQLLFKNCSSTIDLASHLNNGASQCQIESVARQNLASAVETRGPGRKSLSETSVDPNSVCGTVSLRKQFHQEEEYNSGLKMQKTSEDDKYKEVDDCSISNNASSQRSKPLDAGVQVDIAGGVANAEESPFIFDSENSRIHQKQANSNLLSENEDMILPETDGKSANLVTPSNIYKLYESKVAALVRKNGVLEGQLAAALASRETAEKNLSSAIKSRQDMERKLADAVKEVDLLKEKLAAAEIAQEEANSLSNIVHSDNVRLEHDVAFLKAVLDDTQKELHSTRGVLAAERARAFQLQVEVFHLKQRLQPVENRAPTPRKPFHM